MTTINKPPFLGYLHSFRGFAIINIVAIHASVFAGYVFSKSFGPLNPIAIANELLFHNSTIYFAVISGMLFSAVLNKKGYKTFFFSKFKYVFLPYLFFTLVYSIFNDRSNDWFALQPNVEAYLKELPRNFIYGKASFVFWYIPVLFFLYLVTPLLNYLLHIKKWGSWLMAFIIAIPLLVRRVEFEEFMQRDFLSLQTMIYFTGAYAAGMFIAHNLEDRLDWIRRNKWLFIGIAIFSTAGLLYTALHSINRIGVFSINSTLYYIQKISLSALALLFFKNLRASQPKWLNPIAKIAFTIYCAHMIFLFLVIMHLAPFMQNEKFATFNIIGGGILILVLSILLCIIFAWIFRKIFGKYSRMIIGS
ncbi:MAG: acyltransferase [Bacteroidota bacterium]